MRTSKVLALLAEQERKFDRERQSFREERERLLDRIMVLADRPMFDPGPSREDAPGEEPDLMDPTAHLGEDLMDLLR